MSAKRNMTDDRDQRTHRHVELPGGRQIEVVYLDGEPSRTASASASPPITGPTLPPCPPASIEPWLAAEPPAVAPAEALHVCPQCAGGLVHPLDWSEESPGRWRILMRCPDCGMLREGAFGQALVELLDEELDKATASLLSDLRQLTYANMAEEIEVFSRALQLDLIGANDF
jgi:hypothetical protein